MAEELKEDKLVVPADKSTANKKVKVELEVDTSAKDLDLKSYARLIHSKSNRQLENISRMVLNNIHYYYTNA